MISHNRYNADLNYISRISAWSKGKDPKAGLDAISKIHFNSLDTKGSFFNKMLQILRLHLLSRSKKFSITGCEGRFFRRD